MFFMLAAGTDVGSGGVLLCFCVKFIPLLWLFFDDDDDDDVNADENDSGDRDAVSVAADDKGVDESVYASVCMDLAAAAGVNGCRDDDDGGDEVVDDDGLTDAYCCLVCLVDDDDDNDGVDLV